MTIGRQPQMQSVASSASLNSSSSPIRTSKRGGLQFGKRNKEAEQVADEINQRQFEVLCYDATFRVQDNSDLQIKKKKEVFNKIPTQ